MTEHQLARRPALVTLMVSAAVLAALLAVLVPWDWVPGGTVVRVRPDELFTPEQLARAEAYSGVVRRLGWSALAVSLLVGAVLGLTPLGSRLVGSLPRRARVPLAVLVVLLAGRLVTLPIRMAIRQERLDYGLTEQSLAGWLRDQGLSLAVSWVTITAVVGVMVWVARRTPRWWFAWAGAAVAALVFAVSFLYPVLVEPLFNRFTPMPDGELRQSILALADHEGVPVDDVLVADASRRTTTLNAYVSGLGDTHRIVVYDNLLAELPPDQVRLVVAHELAHAKNHDVLTGTTLGAVGAVSAVALLALVLEIPGLRRRARVDGPGDPRIVPLVLVLVSLGTLLASPLQNTVSRAVEARADRVSLEATGDVGTFEHMQVRLAVTSLSDPTPPEWSQLWFGSHPTTVQRIGLARAVAG